jgi:hypothetical protein
MLDYIFQETLSSILQVIKTRFELPRGTRILVRLDQILQELQNIRYRLDDIENMFSKWNPQPLTVPESELFSLPDNLRKSYLIVVSKGECSATEVSNLTGRSRAIESSYLNQLVRMDRLTKRRNSKTLNFRAFACQTAKLELTRATIPLRTNRN